MKSSTRIPREAPVEVVREVWAVMASAGQVDSWLMTVEARNLTRSSVHRYIRAMSTGEGSRSRITRHELLKLVPNKDRVSSCLALCGEKFLLAAALTHAPLVPIRLVFSPMLLSPLVKRSAPVLLLGRWSLPAGPGIVLLVPRMSPLV